MLEALILACYAEHYARFKVAYLSRPTLEDISEHRKFVNKHDYGYLVQAWVDDLALALFEKRLIQYDLIVAGGYPSRRFCLCLFGDRKGKISCRIHTVHGELKLAVFLLGDLVTTLTHDRFSCSNYGQPYRCLSSPLSA